MRTLLRVTLGALLSLAAACDMASTAESEAPQAGKADGTDRADYDCQVVLRDVGRKAGSPFATKDGWIVWSGSVDVAQAALDAGAEVGVLYHRGGPWYEADIIPPSDGNRYGFEMWYGISTGGEGGLNWQQMKIDFVPFLRMPDGTRVFDHNANRDPFANYVLDYSWGPGRWPFTLIQDPNVCPGM